ncbi:hypothetical protein L873DRAFT_405559 [Choiromyces venosus 120613-1]|uniref:Uncharacterized protein n=1 Tax=Choiromyces venosus 120613-1 TaxID=1336337 RepID=A0A3N4JVU1_9PEZI|nr:hypothetical protein L873DRAFT_405559 [Choiromyces venosus 120613-1]
MMIRTILRPLPPSQSYLLNSSISPLPVNQEVLLRPSIRPSSKPSFLRRHNTKYNSTSPPIQAGKGSNKESKKTPFLALLRKSRKRMAVEDEEENDGREGD